MFTTAQESSLSEQYLSVFFCPWEIPKHLPQLRSDLGFLHPLSSHSKARSWMSPIIRGQKPGFDSQAALLPGNVWMDHNKKSVYNKFQKNSQGIYMPIFLLTEGETSSSTRKKAFVLHLPFDFLLLFINLVLLFILGVSAMTVLEWKPLS